MAGAVAVTGLKADCLETPLGLHGAPRLSWRLEADRRGASQSAYRVLAGRQRSEVEAGRGDLWDSGRVESAQCFDISYAGAPLRSRQRCWWSVQVWDEADTAAPLPAPTWWEMGLAQPADWSAVWLAAETAEERDDREAGLSWVWGEGGDAFAARWFRLGFALPENAAEATLFIGARDRLLDARLDGAPIALPEVNRFGFGRPALFEVRLGPLAKGRRLLAAQARVSRNARGGGKGAFAALLRLTSADGVVHRIGGAG